jgi:hypothetical protein
MLSHDLLVWHYQADGPGEVIGAHTADADNRSKGGALDIDQHGDDSACAEANRLAALHWFDQLVRLGFRPLLTASNGKGGYHLRVLLANSIDASRLYHFLRYLSADHRQFGFRKPPEAFPKQPDVRRCAEGLGNWLRLPGRHHKRDFWSRVWNGSAWLAGHAAIDLLLSLTGDDPTLIPDVPLPAPTPPLKRLPRRTYHAYAHDGLSARIAGYAARLPNLGEGQGRDDVAFAFACFLVRDLDLDDAVALEWLNRWDAGNNPPKGEKRLIEIIRSAHAHGQRPYGCDLPRRWPRYDRHGHPTISFSLEVC